MTLVGSISFPGASMGAWAGGTGELAFGWGEAGSAFTTAFSGPGPGAAGGGFRLDAPGRVAG